MLLLKEYSIYDYYVFTSYS